MRICKIQEEKKHRFRIVLEDEQTLLVTERELIAFSLRPGGTLTQTQIEEMKASAQESEAKAQAARIIGSRPLSKGELLQKLLEKGQSEEAAQSAVDQLEAAGAIDDARYAATLARHYAVRGYGPRKIEEELRRRGIDRALWEKALEEGPVPEERAAKYLMKKWGAGGIPQEPKERTRILNSLRRRGFSWNDIESGLALYGEWMEEQ